MIDEFLKTCENCSVPFFTKGERDFYYSKRLTEPYLCKKCRDGRNQKKNYQNNNKIELLFLNISENWKLEAKQESVDLFTRLIKLMR